MFYKSTHNIVSTYSFLLYLSSYLGGCSAIIVEDVMLPIESHEWELTKMESEMSCFGFFSNDNPQAIAKFQCAEFEYTVKHISSDEFLMFGPPIVPLLPIFGKDQYLLSVEFEHSNNSGAKNEIDTCPILTIHKPRNIEISGPDVGGPYIYNCRYALKNINELPKEIALSFKLKDGKCETEKLHFQYFKKIKYCMLFSPNR